MNYSFSFSQIVIAFLMIYSAFVTYIIVRKNGHEAKLSKIKTPFAEFDIQHFERLTAIKVFNNLSVMIRPDRHGVQNLIDDTHILPAIKVHLGWHLVSEAYVRKFDEFPDDSSLTRVTSQIGAQNAEFVKIYREANSACSKSTNVPQKFSTAYLERAPSLAVRIDPDAHEWITTAYRTLVRDFDFTSNYGDH